MPKKTELKDSSKKAIEILNSQKFKILWISWSHLVSLSPQRWLTPAALSYLVSSSSHMVSPHAHNTTSWHSIVKYSLLNFD